MDVLDGLPTTATTVTTLAGGAVASVSPRSPSTAISLTGARKRVKLSPKGAKHQSFPASPPHSKWKTATQEAVYRRRLIEALCSAKRNHQAESPSGAKAPPRAIKEAADSALALTARGQSRWSRAILSRRWRMRRMALKAGGKVRRKKPSAPPVRKWGQASAAAGLKGEKGKEGKVRERLRLLSHLVPGCRKASTPSLLEEAADYVAALQLQVKAMRALADAFSASTTVSSPPDHFEP